MIAILLLPLFASLSEAAPCGRVVGCYYPGYRSTALPPTNIDANVCTHIIFAFAEYDAVNNRITTTSDPNLFTQLSALKNRNPDLKLLISLGGEHVPSNVFQGLVATETKIQAFASTVVPFLQTHGFDGLDVDWEFPSSTDKTSFGLLLKNLRSSLGPSYLLTTAVTANYQTAQDCYPIADMERYLDYVFEMSYNFHGLWESKTGLNSPLTGPSGDPYTSEYIMAQWATLGISKRKLVMGIPAYGPQWTLSTTSNGVNAPATPSTYRLFSEICAQNSSYTWVYDATYGGTYAYKGSDWVSMETPSMVARKAQFTIDNGYGGVMFWEIGQDDFSGRCNSGTFPLVRASKQKLCSGDIITSSTTRDSTTTTTRISTTTTVRTSTTTTTRTSTTTTTRTSTTTTARTSTTTTTRTSTTTTTRASTTTTTRASTTTTTRASTTTTTRTSTTTTTRASTTTTTRTSTTTTTRASTTTTVPSAICPGPGLYPVPNDCYSFYSCVGTGTKPHIMACSTGLVFNDNSKTCDWPANVPSCNSG